MGVNKQRVVVLGASEKPDRYSNQAIRLLLEHGHHVIPVNPVLKSVAGVRVFPDLDHVEGHVDTLSVYVSPEISSSLTEQILSFNPGRIIFNPGTENPDLRKDLNNKGVQTEEACTLVLLRTGQF